MHILIFERLVILSVVNFLCNFKAFIPHLSSLFWQWIFMLYSFKILNEQSEMIMFTIGYTKSVRITANLAP